MKRAISEVQKAGDASQGNQLGDILDELAGFQSGRRFVNAVRQIDLAEQVQLGKASVQQLTQVLGQGKLSDAWKALGNLIGTTQGEVIGSEEFKALSSRTQQFVQGMQVLGGFMRQGKKFLLEKQPDLMESVELLTAKGNMGTTVQSYTKGVFPFLFALEQLSGQVDWRARYFAQFLFEKEQNTMIAGQKHGLPPVLQQMLGQLRSEETEAKVQVPVFELMYKTLIDRTQGVLDDLKLGALTEAELKQLKRAVEFGDVKAPSKVIKAAQMLSGQSEQYIENMLNVVYTQQLTLSQSKFTARKEVGRRVLQLLPGWAEEFREVAQRTKLALSLTEQAGVGNVGNVIGSILGKSEQEIADVIKQTTYKDAQDFYYNTFLFKIQPTMFFGRMFPLKQVASDVAQDIKQGMDKVQAGIKQTVLQSDKAALQAYMSNIVGQHNIQYQQQVDYKHVGELMDIVSRLASYEYDRTFNYNREISRLIYDRLASQIQDLDKASAIIEGMKALKIEEDLGELGQETAEAEAAKELGATAEEAAAAAQDKYRVIKRQRHYKVYMPIGFDLDTYIQKAYQPMVVLSPYDRAGRLSSESIMRNKLLQASTLLASTQKFDVISGGRFAEAQQKLAQSGLAWRGQDISLDFPEYKKIFANFIRRYQQYSRVGYEYLKLAAAAQSPKAIGVFQNIKKAQEQFAGEQLQKQVLEIGPFDKAILARTKNMLAVSGNTSSPQYIMAQWLLKPQPITQQSHIQEAFAQALRAQFTGDVSYLPKEIAAKLNIDEFTEKLIGFIGSKELYKAGDASAELINRFKQLFGGLDIKVPERLQTSYLQNMIKQATEFIDYEAIRGYTGIKELQVELGGGLTGTIVGARTIDRIAIQSPNRIGSMVVKRYERFPQRMSWIKFFLQGAAVFDELKRTIGSQFIEAANVRVGYAGKSEYLKSLAQFLQEFSAKQHIDVGQPPGQPPEIQNLADVFNKSTMYMPALAMSDEEFQKLVDWLVSNNIISRGQVGYPSFAGDAVFQSQSFLKVLQYEAMTEEGIRYLNVPKNIKISGAGREKGMVSTLPFDIYAELVLPSNEKITVPIAYAIGSQQSRLNKMTVIASGLMRQQKQLGYENVGKLEFENLPDAVKQTLDYLTLKGAQLRPSRLLVKVGNKLVPVGENINQLFIQHAPVFNLSQDFSAGISSIRQIALQTMLTTIISGQSGIHLTPYSPGVHKQISDLATQAQRVQELNEQFGGTLYLLDRPLQSAAQDQFAYNQQANLEQFKQFIVSKMQDPNLQHLMPMLQDTLVFTDIMKRVSEEYVNISGKFITLEQLMQVQGQEDFFKRVLSGNAQIYIGSLPIAGTQSMQHFTVGIMGAFSPSSEQQNTFVLTQIGNKLRNYFIQLGAALQGKPVNIEAQLGELKYVTAQQWQRTVAQRSGVAFVGRLSTLSNKQNGQSVPAELYFRLLNRLQAQRAGASSKDKIFQYQYLSAVKFIDVNKQTGKISVGMLDIFQNMAPDIAADYSKDVVESTQLLLGVPQSNIEIKYMPFEQMLNRAIKTLEMRAPKSKVGILQNKGSYELFMSQIREPQLIVRPIVKLGYLNKTGYLGVPQEIAQAIGGDDDADILAAIMNLFVSKDVIRRGQQLGDIRYAGKSSAIDMAQWSWIFTTRNLK